jgi:hypothetical protein
MAMAGRRDKSAATSALIRERQPRLPSRRIVADVASVNFFSLPAPTNFFLLYSDAIVSCHCLA